MINRWTILLISLLAFHAFSLHMLDNTQAQIDALKSQQSRFQTRVNKLLTNITQLERNLNRTTNIDEKVLLLQSAITSEREQIFNLSTIIIPPFNITKQGCQKMTDQQKVQLLEELAKARAQVTSLKGLASSMPSCPDIETIKRDIDKQIFFLNSIQSIIYTNCSMNVILSPTIFQSNIYADGWVLGNMTIDDLIQQYYQRSIRYDNITNCPIQTPFFDGRQCINCGGQTPVFDISQKKCVACGAGYHVDNVKRKCVPNVYYTVWENVTNFSPKDGPFPTPEPGATPCPPNAPYYNGATCIPCQLPNYFNIQTLKCQPCQQGAVFDINDRQCSTIQKNYLTNLASRWVTAPGNFTNVMQQRAAIIQKNRTSGNYRVCPQSQPYFDGIKCIPCQAPLQQFNLNTRQCTTVPNNQTQYNPNVHSYLPIPTNPGETLPNAPRLIGQLPANDPAVADCPAQTPHWDGLNCILCPQPFELFDVASRTCVACQAQDYYNATLKACVPRPIIYVSNRQDRLLATPNVSVDDYRNNLADIIRNNPQAIVAACQPTQYSDYKQCVNCNAGEYFNVQTLRCQVCNLVYDPVTRLCKKPEIPGEVFTNFNNGSMIIGVDPDQQKQNIEAQLQQNPKSTLCPLSTPYMTPSGCISCSRDSGKIFFDYQSKQCVGCNLNQSYLSGDRCIAKPTVSNLPVLLNQSYLDPTNKIPVEQQKIQYYQNTSTPFNVCPPQQPYFNDTSKACQAVACMNVGEYFDYSRGVCVPCANYDASTKTCPPPAPRYPNLTSDWVAGDSNKVVQFRDALAKVPGATICPTTAPHFSNLTQTCVSCAVGFIFDYDTGQCRNCAPQVYDINVRKCLTPDPNLRQTLFPTAQNLIYGSIPSSQWQDYYNQNKTAGAIDCPMDPTNAKNTQYYDGIACINCPTTHPYFNLEYRLCMNCPPEAPYKETQYYKGCMLTSSGNQLEIGPDIAKMYANIF